MGPSGAIIMSIWAAVWCILGLYLGGAPLTLAAMPLAATLAIVIFGVRRERAAAPRPAMERRRIGKIVGWASAFEGVGFLAIINATKWVGRPDLVMPGLAIIVGLHFLPLAYLFPARRLYATAMALMLIGVVVPFAVGGAAAIALIVGVIAACILWLTSLAAIIATPRAVPT